MTPNFKSLLTLLIGLSLLVLAMRARPDTLATPYASIGAGHRDAGLSSNVGWSDTPGYLEAGLRLQPDETRWYYLGADELSVGWRHQSYVDRGWPVGGEEDHIDSYAVLFTWRAESWRFTLPF